MAVLKIFNFSILIYFLPYHGLVQCTQDVLASNFADGVNLNRFIDQSQKFRQQLIRDMGMDPGQLPDMFGDFQLDSENSSKLQLNLTNGIMYGFSESTRYGDYIAKLTGKALRVVGTTQTPLLTTHFKYRAEGENVADEGTFNVTFEHIVVDFALEFDFHALRMRNTRAETIKIGKSNAVMASDYSSNSISDLLIERVIKPHYTAQILKAVEKVVVQLLERSPSKIFEKFWEELINQGILNLTRVLQKIIP